MTFIDWFAGIGGIRLGFERGGHQCIGFCEYDKFATASYTSMHLITEEQLEYLNSLDLKKRQNEILKEEYRNGEWYAKDITTVRAEDVPKADCWCFGSPCQSFSVAGKRAGLEGQSGLIQEIFRLLRETREEDRPEWLFYENVKGMFSSNNGFDFLTILLEMDELGYDAEWQLCNSKDFGVPHNRERVFTIGHLRRRSAAKVLPIESPNGTNSVPVKIIGHRDGYIRNTQIFSLDGITEALDTAAGGGRGHHTVQIIKPSDIKNGTLISGGGGGSSQLTDFQIKGIIDDQGRTTKECIIKQEAPTLRSQSHGNEPKVVVDIKPLGVDIANILDTKCSQGIFVQVSDDLLVYAIWYEKEQCYIAIRKLTPRECFRLQSFPDEYFERAQSFNSDSQLYKQAGNSVTVNVIHEIARRMEKH